MSHHDNSTYLLDIQQAAALIETFIGNMDEEHFLDDKKTQAAVQHQIMIIGEATKRLSQAFREENAHIPWAAISRMRDRLIHGYTTVDMRVVWITATQSVPDLVRAINSLSL